LIRSLFLARPVFCDPLLKMNGILAENRGTKLVSVDSGVMNLSNFEADQVKLRTRVGRTMEDAVLKVANVAEDLCQQTKDRMTGANNEEPQKDAYDFLVVKSGKKEKGMVEEIEEAREKKRIAQKARVDYELLGKFIRLADYMVVESLGKMVVDGRLKFFADLCARKPMKEMFLQSVVMTDEKSPGAPYLEYTPSAPFIESVLYTTWSELCKIAHMSPPRLIHISTLKKYLVNARLERAPSQSVEFNINNSVEWIKTALQLRMKVSSDFKLLQANCEAPLM